MRYLILLVMLFSSPVFAQQNSPRLLVDLDDKTEPIHLSKFDAEIKILGEIAETRMTLTFFNPHKQMLEGSLYFPLPEGVTISGYALDVNGVMVDGVVVEKHTARRVFEREERKRIDPGLVEWIKGNNFQTRIYPIPAEGTRTVMIRFVSPLSRISGRTSYQLPLDFPEKLNQFHLRAEVVRSITMPIVTQGSLENFGFSAWHDSYVAETTLKDVTLNKKLVIDIPDVEKTPVRVEKDGKNSYFIINDYQAASFTPKIGKSRSPRRISVYWDASGSRSKKDHQRELHMLEMLFAQWKTTKVELELILFRNAAEPPRYFTINKGDASQLLSELRMVFYDGGTQLSSILPTADSMVPDYYLLFTDGISNFGIEEPTGFKAPLYAISDDPTSNHSLLSWLATNANGQYLNLSNLDDQTVIKSIGLPVYQFISARYDPNAINETYPKTPEAVHGRFTLTGKLLAPRAEITLEFGTAGRVRKVIKYVINQEGASDGKLLSVFWAQKKIKELTIFAERNQSELTATGKQYGLVTPGTSLLVLETLEQYVQYKIEPPASLPELRDKYLEQITEKTEEKENEKDKIDKILERWNERVEWWETDFSKASVNKPKEIEPQRHAAPSPVERQTVPERPRESSSAAKPEPLREPEPIPSQNTRSTNLPASKPSTLRIGRAMLSGVVRDQSEAVISGVQVTAIEMQTGAQGSTTTDNRGAYRISGIINGAYTVRAEIGGFNTKTITNVLLTSNAPVRLDIRLDLAGITTAVEISVETSTMLLESSSSVSTIIKNDNNEESIEIRGWDPDTPYLDKLKQVAVEQYLQVYLEQRENYSNSPAFFLDCADFFLKHQQREIGLRILSNIAELQLENPAFLRILAHRLDEIDETELSRQLFETVLKMRPEEPQSYRDLALVLAEQKKYLRAMELLNHVVMNKWDRFDGIEVIALMELNQIIPLAREQGITEIPLDPRLIKLLDVDIRVVLTWDANMTDIDLWVTEPSGEKAFYKAPLTEAGGQVSTDFTEGYGPEEYVIHHAKPGKYTIQADYFGSSAQSLQGAVTVQADVFTNFGRKNEKRQRLTLRIDKEKDTFNVGEIIY